MNSFDRAKFDDFLLGSGCVGFFDPPITLKSGRPGFYYINIRNAISTLYGKRKVAENIYNFCMNKGIRPDYFLGVPEGATPLGQAVTDLIEYKDPEEIPSVILRAKPKEHGDPKDRFSVGSISKGDRIGLIEDITTTGGSTMTCIPRILEAGAEIMKVIAVASRLEKSSDMKRGVAEVISDEFGIDYECLTDSSTLVPKAFQQREPGRKVGEDIEKYFKEYGTMELKIL